MQVIFERVNKILHIIKTTVEKFFSVYGHKVQFTCKLWNLLSIWLNCKVYFSSKFLNIPNKKKISKLNHAIHGMHWCHQVSPTLSNSALKFLASSKAVSSVMVFASISGVSSPKFCSLAPQYWFIHNTIWAFRTAVSPHFLTLVCTAARCMHSILYIGFTKSFAALGVLLSMRSNTSSSLEGLPKKR